MTGRKRGCKYNLYSIPLTKPQTKTWSGIWATCDVSENTPGKDKERCRFKCHCRGGCEEIQITKRPRNVAENSWSLCHITVAYMFRGTVTNTNFVSFTKICLQYPHLHTYEVMTCEEYFTFIILYIV